jgi:hypothetical protein
MLKLRLFLCSIGVLATLGLVGVAGCSSESLRAGDGGGDHPVTGDPAACGCQVDGPNLTISWSCFCAQHDCSSQPRVQCTGSGRVTSGCGLVDISLETIGGPEQWVYDDSGNLVGEQLATDDGQFACPTDPSMVGFTLRAGQFPDTCDNVISTGCTVDAGAANDPAACGCQVTDGILTMSWACYCQQYSCTQPEPHCGAYGQWTRGCGLDEYAVLTIGGPERWVYDPSGHLVGAQQSTDAGYFRCPTDPSMTGSSVRAGQFADTCDSRTVCQCSADGGSCDPTDAGLGYL